MAVKGIGKPIIVDNTKNAILFAYALHEKLNVNKTDIKNFLKKVQGEWPVLSDQLIGRGGYIENINEFITRNDSDKTTKDLLQPLADKNVNDKVFEMEKELDTKGKEIQSIRTIAEEKNKSPCTGKQFLDFLKSVVTCLSSAHSKSGNKSTIKLTTAQSLFTGGDSNKFFPIIVWDEEGREIPKRWGDGGDGEQGLKYSTTSIEEEEDVTSGHAINMVSIYGVRKLIKYAEDIIMNDHIKELSIVMRDSFVCGVRYAKAKTKDIEKMKHILKSAEIGGGFVDPYKDHKDLRNGANNNPINLYQYGMLIATITLMWMSSETEKKYSDLALLVGVGKDMEPQLV